jgi:hypothetical protein
MDINSIAPLLINTLNSINQKNSKVSNETFASLLSEVLLQSELDNSSLDSSSQLDSGLTTLFSSLGQDPNLTSSLSTIENEPSVSSLQSTDSSVASLNAHLKGALANNGDLFVKAGEMFQVSPALLAAISMHETGNGTSNAARFKYNVAGMMGKDGLKTYSSIEESILDMARNLKHNYIDAGKNTIAQIGAKYAPIGATNDPTGLNNNWVTGVQQYFNMMTNEADLA